MGRIVSEDRTPCAPEARAKTPPEVRTHARGTLGHEDLRGSARPADGGSVTSAVQGNMTAGSRLGPLTFSRCSICPISSAPATRCFTRLTTTCSVSPSKRLSLP